MQTKMEIEPLPWDSSVFGYSVGRIFWQHLPSSELLDALDKEGRRWGYRLIYCFWPSPPPETSQESKRFSYLGGHQCYVMRRKDLPNQSENLHGICVCHNHTIALQRLALESGRFSRFALDPMFCHGEFQAVYRRWLENAFDGQRGGACCIAGSDNDPDGFLTLEPSSDRSSIEIGLLAVHERSRRTGIGTRLLNFARKWSFEVGVQALTVKTQWNNDAGKAFYVNNGFEAVSTHSVAHFWVN